MTKIYTYYLPTYLKEKDPNDTHCTLMVRHYKRYKTISGNMVTTYDMDAVVYPTEEAMATAIEAEQMRELPVEADGNPNYVPIKLRSPQMRRVQKVTS